MTLASTTDITPAHIREAAEAEFTIRITEEVVQTFRLTARQLDDLGLPADQDALSEMDGDELATTLYDSELETFDHVVEERDIEIIAPAHLAYA